MIAAHVWGWDANARLPVCHAVRELHHSSGG